MEGVYLTSLIPEIENAVLGRRSSGLKMLSRRKVALMFDHGALVLDTGENPQSIVWQADPGRCQPMKGSWDEHVNGATVNSVGQQGTDRVLEIGLEPAGLYSTSETRLVFEATGRDGNLVLVRSRDGRILSALRRVTGRMSSYRTVAPGSAYRPPPPSGAAPGLWSTDDGIRDALSGTVTPRDIYSRLEGVGPVTARALLAEAAASGTGVHRQVVLLADALAEGRYSHWMGPDGPLPVRLGPGTPIEDPLEPLPATIVRAKREEAPHVVLASRETERLERRVARLEEALRELVPGETYRKWAELILSAGGGRERGNSVLEITDWEGVAHRIPLRESRTLSENAQRYFRKASNARREKRHLADSLDAARGRITRIAELLSRGDEGAEDLFRELGGAGSSGGTAGGKRNYLETVLTGGWRCLAGRNAADNDRVTFEAGRKGDYWFHARGTTGAHVVLKMDGRRGPPPAHVMREAAAVAAARSGTASGVVPVDYTLVQNVRRVKGGKPGQVLYSREKTLFVDLDRKPPSGLDSGRQRDKPPEGEENEP